MAKNFDTKKEWCLLESKIFGGGGLRTKVQRRLAKRALRSIIEVFEGEEDVETLKCKAQERYKKRYEPWYSIQSLDINDLELSLNEKDIADQGIVAGFFWFDLLALAVKLFLAWWFSADDKEKEDFSVLQVYFQNTDNLVSVDGDI